MRNAGLEEAQAGIKIAGRNINNLRWTGRPGVLRFMGSHRKWHLCCTLCFSETHVEDEDGLYDCVYGEDEGGEVYEDLMKAEEAQAGIKISGRNVNNLRYADDTTLMAESEEELKADRKSVV